MKKEVYLAAALIGMGGLVCLGCSDDEKIVEVEKEVVKEVEKEVPVQDLTKLSDATREGLKGNPKNITEYYAMSSGSEAPSKWDSKTIISYNSAGYKTVQEVHEAYYDKIEIETDQSYLGDFKLFKDKDFKLTKKQTITLGEDNKPTKIEEMRYELYYFLITVDDDSYMMYDIRGGEWMNSGDITGGEPVGVKDYSIKANETELITTIDKTAKKATRIVRVKSVMGEGNFEDSKKSVLDLDEFGWPNENSKEDFNPAYSYKLSTRAFEEESTKYIEVLDQKGNWIVRYTTDIYNPYYKKRDIVYY